MSVRPRCAPDFYQLAELAVDEESLAAKHALVGHKVLTRRSRLSSNWAISFCGMLV